MPSARNLAMSFSISALAPTSIPRVGSSRMMSLGCVTSQRASRTFCWLPPERFRIGVSAPGVLIFSAAI